MDKPNVSRTKLLQLLLKEIKEKEMLLQENDKLKSEIIQRTVPMHVLQKVFTPGQIKPVDVSESWHSDTMVR